MQEPTKKQSEAPESSAGDDFHVLWTVKRSFDLLNFDDNGLKAITIEGIDPKTAVQIDPYGTELLGVDIAEYFGGESFNDAQKVVISQLKYSTRRVDQNWTFYDLYKGKKKGIGDGSIIHRLAQAYKIFLKEFGRDQVLQKLTLKLTSNREFSPAQKQLLDDIQTFVEPQTTKVYVKTLVQKFPNDKEAIEKLHQATKLGSAEFADFLYLLDFEDCGTASRIGQEITIIQAMKGVGIANQTQSNTLFRNVWRKMLPNAESSKITAQDFLHWLGTSLEGLFPVTHKFEPPAHWIERQQVGTIMDTIVQNSGKPICLHGTAGVGKSATAQLIKKNFPKGSEVILFDCYGRGDYSNPSDGRHLHQEAIVQICNELAKKLGTPFLVPQQGVANHIYVRELKDRVSLAVKILQQKTPDAMLVLLVDAADNSVTAAQDKKSTSFVQDLLQEPFDESFRLVVTTRTHRVASLDLPHDHINVHLEGFTEEETQQLLSFYYPNNTPEEAQEFHDLTYGVPRVQMYALKLKQAGIDEVINYLKPTGKKVEDIFQEAIQSAAKRLGKSGVATIDTFFEHLVALPTPVPLSYLQVTSDFSNDELKDFANEIWHGLILEKSSQTLSFRDEDFETYVREKYKPSQTMYEKVIDLLLERAHKDEYASVHLGIALSRANQSKRLAEIVINEEYQDLPTNPIRKKEVYVERTQLAMKLNGYEGDALTFFQLAFIAADAAKTDAALWDLLMSNVDLVAALDQTDSLYKLYSFSKDKPWAGIFNLTLAVAYSRNKVVIKLAKKHLEEGEAWLRWWIENRNDEKVKDYKVTAKDLAQGVEACLNIYGAKAAHRWLNYWRLRHKIAPHLFESVLSYATEKQITTWLSSLSLTTSAQLFVINQTAYFKSPPEYDFDNILNVLSRFLVRKPTLDFQFQLTLLSFCEAYIGKHPNKQTQVLPVLDQIQEALPQYIPYFMKNSLEDEAELQFEILLRKRTLKAVLGKQTLTLEDIYSVRFKEIDKLPDARKREAIRDDKQKFDRFYKHALAIYQLRADALVGNSSSKDLKVRFDGVCEDLRDDWEFRHYGSYTASNQLRFFAGILVEIVPFLGKKPYDLIVNIIDACDDRKQKNIDLRMAVAQKVARISEFHKIVYKLLASIAKLIENAGLHGTKTIEYYSSLARIAVHVEPDIGRTYFNKATEAVTEVDTDAWEKIKCIQSLTKIGIPANNPELAHEFANFVEYCHARLGQFDEEYFPMNESIQGIANLDTPTAFAVLCRWDHRQVIKLPEQILNLLDVALRKQYISPAVGSSLLPLNIHYWKTYLWYAQELIRQYDQQGDVQAKSLFVQHLIKDVELHCDFRNAEGIMLGRGDTMVGITESLQGGKYLNTSIKQELEQFHQFIAQTSLAQNDDTTTHQDKSKKSDTNEETPELDFDGIDLTSYLSLNNELKKINEEQKAFDARRLISEFLEQIKEELIPADYVAHLDALINVDSSLLDFYYFEQALKSRLDDWGDHPLVEEWKAKSFEKVFKLWYFHFFRQDKVYLQRIADFADLFSIDDDALSNVIARILPDKIDELSASVWYQLISFLSNKLTPETNEALLTSVLAHSTKKISEKFIDRVFADYALTNNTTSEVIAQTLRYVLGHPDNRIKWRGVHALRRLVEAGNAEVLQRLLALQNQKDCHPFQHKDYPFFWISAKLYLWVCIARISQENPVVIAQFKAVILQEVNNSSLPHALILYFVKQTCWHLHEHNKNLFSVTELQQIEDLLVSQLTPLGKQHQRTQPVTVPQPQFNFDSLDTLPYWYRRLGERFALSEQAIAHQADQYISGQFGYTSTNNIREDDHVKAEYQLTSNRHGSLSTIEDLRKYYEYHAMFCVAADLILSHPLRDNNPDEYDSWENWLTHHAQAFENLWLSDLRTPLPRNAKFWINSQGQIDRGWKDGVSEERYDKEIGLLGNSSIVELNLNGYYTNYYGKNYENVSISSALVSPTTSAALLRALQTSEDHHDYKIPLEEDSLIINHGDFQLLGWLKQEYNDAKGLESNNLLAGNIRAGYTRFGQEVHQLFDIEYDPTFHTAYYQKKCIATYQNWDNMTDYRGYDEVQSTGYLFTVDVEFLLKFLAQRNMYLIVECVVERYLDSDQYGYDDYKRENKAKLYLIKANGEVTTLRGRNYKIGQKTGQ